MESVLETLHQWAEDSNNRFSIKARIVTTEVERIAFDATEEHTEILRSQKSNSTTIHLKELLEDIDELAQYEFYCIMNYADQTSLDKLEQIAPNKIKYKISYYSETYRVTTTCTIEKK